MRPGPIHPSEALASVGDAGRAPHFILFGDRCHTSQLDSWQLGNCVAVSSPHPSISIKQKNRVTTRVSPETGRLEVWGFSSARSRPVRGSFLEVDLPDLNRNSSVPYLVWDSLEPLSMYFPLYCQPYTHTSHNYLSSVWSSSDIISHI